MINQAIIQQLHIGCVVSKQLHMHTKPTPNGCVIHIYFKVLIKVILHQSYSSDAKCPVSLQPRLLFTCHCPQTTLTN